MKSVNAGVIGVGRIGKIHTENLCKMPRVAVKAVSDVSVSAELQTWADGLPIEEGITTNYTDIIENPNIDVVFICSSTNTHVPIVIEAAKQGKHVFCEKPLSFDTEQTKLALQAAREAGIQLQIGFNRRFDHNFKRVRELVEGGEIGVPQLIKVTSRDPFPPPASYIGVSGGMFVDMTIHDFDMARYMAGSDVVEVYAKGSVLVDPVFHDYDDIDTAVITLTFASGALGIIDNSRKAVYGYDQRVEVFGSGGCITVKNDFHNSAEVSTERGVYSDKPKLFFLERYQESFRQEVSAFIDSILERKEVPVSGHDGLQAELIALAAKKSFKLGRAVRLEEVN